MNVQTRTPPEATSPLAFLPLNKAIVVLGLCAGLAYAAWLLDRASIGVQWFTYGFSWGFYLNAIPVVLVFLVLLALCNRVALALLVTLVLTAALYLANFLKLKYLAIPVAYSDIYVLENLHVATIKLLGDYVDPGAVLGGLAGFVVLVAVSFWKEPRFFGRRSWPRVVVVVVTLSCLISVGAGSRWVGRRVYNADRLRVIPYSSLLTVLHGGLIGSLVYTVTHKGRALDEPIDQHAIKRLLAMPTGPTVPDPAYGGQQPDIVVIQSESFFDPRILGDVGNTDRLLPNLHRALAQGIGGTMQPPTFGGGTLRTEFEVLTGIPMDAYPRVEFPYLQITRKTIPSIIHVANDAGYDTIAIHANSGAFWNRDQAFRAIGFDRFITERDFPADAQRDGHYIDDAAMTDEIIKQLDEARKPAFIFAISIEAHGPYLDDPVNHPARRDAIPAPPGLHGNALLEYRNYMYHIEDADTQMGRLWNWLAARKRPYILVFYGDHLPALTHAYKQAGFDNGKSGPEQFVPWFIVGSDLQPRNMHVYSWMIGSELLQAAGVPMTPYYRLIDKARLALAEAPGAAHRQAVLQGVDSLARLYLQGKLAGDLKAAHWTGNSHAVATGN